MSWNRRKSRRLGRYCLLAALGFVLGTCEFVIVGILPEIAEGLNTSLAAVGKLVSVFAACYAVGTPVITAPTGGISRRKPLAVLMGVFLLTSAASFAAPNVAVLYATRVVAALVSGTLTAVAMLYAKGRSPPGADRPGHLAGIRRLFRGSGAGSAPGHCRVPDPGLAVDLRRDPGYGRGSCRRCLRSLPAVPAQADSGLLKSFSILWDPRCSLCVGMIPCGASATYIVYTYLSPILTETLGLPAGAVSPAAAGDGSVRRRQQSHLRPAGGRGGLRTLPMAFAAQAVLFALPPPLLGNRWAGLAGVFAMGSLMYLLNTPAQMHALSLAEQDYPFASSLCASVQPVSYNFGIAIGSFIGAAVQEGWGFLPLGLPAAMFALAALGLNLPLLRANGRRTAAAAS